MTTTTPTFEIHEVRTHAEFVRLNEVLWTANFHPYEPIFTLCHATTGPAAADRAADIARDTDLHWTAHTQNPASHYIYALDRTSGRVAGGCEWSIHHSNPFPRGPQPVACTCYPEGSTKAEFAAQALTQCLKPRQAWFARAHAGVSRMGVHPDFRRRGVGRLLMRWGHERIDALGYECFIESGAMGRWLYEECGYRRVMGLAVDVARKNPSEEWERLMFEYRGMGMLLLWRPPRGAWDGKVPDGPWAVTEETWQKQEEQQEEQQEVAGEDAGPVEAV
ncbi:GNAT family N-acetyltransferase [Aspergillus homomorphus CBS 101889]|uniref:GNAT family acetyltransferase n=1 Tax=Aspergillus homomorphus (strain CBS 101889) TaxID=1450537 RepID=A0A395HKA5_ASPHC|nr:GNAT family acetyltransferase [Aspergillus homomorphus CBS 101889]RAL08247.1 GNAT family acetyltransferase [Aspergillus homomorphus CBS 101889]